MDTAALSQRILAAKMRLLNENTFFGLLMQHIIFAVDEQCPTACTDGTRIYFGAEFCERLDDQALLVVMLHELMHIVLGHCGRSVDLDAWWYNVAADVVVNSNIMAALHLPALRVDGCDLMHLAPDGKEGRLYTAEEVYDMLVQSLPQGGSGGGEGDEPSDGDGTSGSNGTPAQNKRNARGAGAAQNKTGKEGGKAPTAQEYRDAFHDDHSTWQAEGALEKGKWRQRIADAAQLSASMGCGDETGLRDRLLDQLTHPTINWRQLLNNFVQQEINDYSFMPPDRRYDGDIFLPDFNVPDDSIHDLWLVLDTSGSISSKDLARAFSEVKGAIEQFGGHLDGMLSFFDTAITDPVPFESVRDLLQIAPRGGGGTSFHVVFDYYKKHLHGRKDIAGIIFFTDGYAAFPPQSMAMGVPVFWLINNNNVTPPWGIVARYLPK